MTGPCCRQSKSTLWRRSTAGPNKEALVVSESIWIGARDERFVKLGGVNDNSFFFSRVARYP